MSDVETIADYVSRALARITTPFKKGDEFDLSDPTTYSRFQALVAALANEVQSLEDAAFVMKLCLSLDAAEDVQLDMFGEILDFPRDFELGDDEYRALLRLQILFIRSCGEPERLVSLLSGYAPTPDPADLQVWIQEYPSLVIMTFNGISILSADRLNYQMKSAAPAGVGMALVRAPSFPDAFSTIDGCWCFGMVLPLGSVILTGGTWGFPWLAAYGSPIYTGFGGCGVQFDPSNPDYFEIDPAPECDFSAAFSVAFKIRPTGSDAVNSIMSKASAGAAGWHIWLANGCVGATLKGTSQIQTVPSTNDLRDGGDGHTVVVLCSLTSIKIYVDGVVDSETTGTWTPNPATSEKLLIGKTSSVYYRGEIVNVQFFNGLLTESEIANIVESGYAGGVYPFDGDDGGETFGDTGNPATGGDFAEVV